MLVVPEHIAVSHPTGAVRYLRRPRQFTKYFLPVGTKVKVVGHTRRHVKVRRYVSYKTNHEIRYAILIFNVRPEHLSYYA